MPKCADYILQGISSSTSITSLCDGEGFELITTDRWDVVSQSRSGWWRIWTHHYGSVRCCVTVEIRMVKDLNSSLRIGEMLCHSQDPDGEGFELITTDRWDVVSQSRSGWWRIRTHHYGSVRCCVTVEIRMVKDLNSSLRIGEMLCHSRDPDGEGFELITTNRWDVVSQSRSGWWRIWTHHYGSVRCCVTVEIRIFYSKWLNARYCNIFK